MRPDPPPPASSLVPRPALALALAWVHALFILSVGSACGLEPLARDCLSLTAEARDECLADEALTLVDTPDAALERASQIESTATRDLVLSHLARTHGTGSCDGITDRVLRESCSTLAQRPHLSIPEPTDAEAPAAEARVPQTSGACGTLPQALTDACLRREAGRGEPGQARDACLGIASLDLRGDCLADTAVRLANTGAPQQAADLCALAPAGPWQDECFFRLSEATPIRQLEPRSNLCKQAGRYRDECQRHLIQASAHAGALRARFGSLDETLEGLALDLEAMVSLLEPEQRSPAAQLFWYEAFHVMLGEAAQRSSLPELGSMGRAALVGDPRAPWWTDCWIAVGVRTWMIDQPAPEPGVGADLDQLQGHADAMLMGAPERSAADAPLFVGPGPTPPPYPNLAIGEVPSPLTLGCPLDSDARQAIRALWGLEILPFGPSINAFEGASRHRDVAVRAYALDMLEHKVFFWQRDDPDRDRAAIWLSRTSENDPSPAIRARAANLAEGLQADERPGRWALSRDTICPRKSGVVQ